jgi:hypothetical protein
MTCQQHREREASVSGMCPICLQADNERLRAALREIADLSSVSYRAPHLARAALEHKPQENERCLYPRKIGKTAHE